MTAPLPPADLDARAPNFLHLPADTIVHRFYTAGLDPIFFDRGRDGRLDAPDGSYEGDLDEDWFWELAERYGVGLAP